jgi:hypothetical protein
MYNTPELLLVGAAPQLVLGNSFTPSRTELSDCPRPTDDQESGALYYDEPAW